MPGVGLKQDKLLRYLLGRDKTPRLAAAWPHAPRSTQKSALPSACRRRARICSSSGNGMKGAREHFSDTAFNRSMLRTSPSIRCCPFSLGGNVTERFQWVMGGPKIVVGHDQVDLDAIDCDRRLAGKHSLELGRAGDTGLDQLRCAVIVVSPELSLAFQKRCNHHPEVLRRRRSRCRGGIAARRCTFRGYRLRAIARRR